MRKGPVTSVPWCFRESVMMQSRQLECECRKDSSYVVVVMVVVVVVSLTEELKF